MLKESIERYCSLSEDEIALHLWPMFLEDEHLLSASTMSGYETEEIAQRLEEFGLKQGRDMVIVTASDLTVEVDWLEVGLVASTPICWRTGANPRPIARHEFISTQLPKTSEWESELQKFGIQVERLEPISDDLYQCTRGEATATLECKEQGDRFEICSLPISPERRMKVVVDQELLYDVKFCLWKLSEFAQIKNENRRVDFSARLLGLFGLQRKTY